jgi:hypothetical protein
MVELRDIVGYTMYTTGGVMCVCYIVLLVHIYLGNRNTWIAMATLMLLVSQIGVVLMGYTW